MIGKPTVIMQIPDKRKFSMEDAARYLGWSEKTLREKSDLGVIPARKEGRYRVYLLEDLDRYVENLPLYESGEFPGERYIKPALKAVEA